MQPIYNWDGDAMVLYIDKLDDLGRMFSYAINPMVIDMIVLNVKVIFYISCVCTDYQFLYYITFYSILKIDNFILSRFILLGLLFISEWMNLFWNCQNQEWNWEEEQILYCKIKLYQLKEN